jgi:uncharacterized protein YbjT (DUF2867 family)
MNAYKNETSILSGPVLVLGGTGKTGRRVASLLESRNVPVRIGSRSASPAFDWNNQAAWDACLEGIRAVYITYAPDLAVPGATDGIAALVAKAGRHGVQRLVLLSGRGEAEAQACEKIVQESGLEWTIVRASWFNQNFSEGAFLDMVHAGAITLPAGDTPEPFVDVDDIAYVEVPHEAFISEVSGSGAPEEVVWMLDYLFSTVLDGRNADLTDGIQRALGRAPRDFSDFARSAAAAGVWAS